jgi:PAS domain S-box-containing protein
MRKKRFLLDASIDVVWFQTGEVDLNRISAGFCTSPLRCGLRVALIYGIIGIVWVVFSDIAVDFFFGAELRSIHWAQTIKGSFFVVASAVLIFSLTSRTVSSMRRSEADFEESRRVLSTERKQAQEAQQRWDEIYRALVDGTSDAILMVDGNRNIISINRAFIEMFGYSREELEGSSVRLVHPSDESFVEFGTLAYRALEDAPLRIEWELRRKDGTVFPIEGTYSAIRGADGSIRGHVGIIRDITQRKKSEAELDAYREHLEEMVRDRTRELEEAQDALVLREKLKTLGTIAAEVAHGIRNPLVSIGGFAKRLQKKNPDLPEAEIILRESQRLEVMLTRLGEYLRPVQMKPRESNVNDILSQSVDALGSELKKEDAAVNLDLEPELPSAHVDPVVLRQVFLAMVRNALQMTSSEKVLTIRTYHGQYSVFVDLRTQVPEGMVGDLELLLHPFEESGESLGISSSFKLLKGMGGGLSFSQVENRATFTVSLVKCQAAGSREEDQQWSKVG